MKNEIKRFSGAIIICLLSASLMVGCSSGNNPQIDAGDDPQIDSENDSQTMQGGAQVKTLGEFTTQDVNGKTYTQDIFKDYDLTMVNVFTTWCTPCVQEIPELEKLSQNMKDRGVNVIGVALDVLDEKGNINEDTLEKAQLLAKETGATYPMLLPDSTYMNGRLIGIEAVPETFFVDKDGNIVGEVYVGSSDLEKWTEAVEKELAALKEAQ